MSIVYKYPKAKDFKCARPHVLRNRIERYQHELSRALPASIQPRATARAIVPFNQTRAIVPYTGPKRQPVNETATIAPAKPVILTRQQRADAFAAALSDPNFRAEDLMNLSTALLKQSAYEAYYGEIA